MNFFQILIVFSALLMSGYGALANPEGGKESQASWWLSLHNPLDECYVFDQLVTLTQSNLQGARNDYREGPEEIEALNVFGSPLQTNRPQTRQFGHGHAEKKTDTFELESRFNRFLEAGLVPADKLNIASRMAQHLKSWKRLSGNPGIRQIHFVRRSILLLEALWEASQHHRSLGGNIEALEHRLNQIESGQWAFDDPELIPPIHRQKKIADDCILSKKENGLMVTMDRSEKMPVSLEIPANNSLSDDNFLYHKRLNERFPSWLVQIGELQSGEKYAVALRWFEGDAPNARSVRHINMIFETEEQSYSCWLKRKSQLFR